MLLLVEVSSSSATFDRQVKMPLYAQGGIRQAWLVDLDAGVVEVYRLNDKGLYDTPELVSGDVRVVIDAFPDVELDCRRHPRLTSYFLLLPPFLTAARLASRAAMRSTTLGASSAASSTTISWPAAFCSMSSSTRSR